MTAAPAPAPAGAHPAGRTRAAVDLTAAYRAVVHAATLAPSVHNSQPWRFLLGDGGLDLFADEARRLPVLDPRGRLVHLSCGAALVQAQVAARALGLHATATLLPDSTDAGHLARLVLLPGAPAGPDECALGDAIELRHTYRDAFQELPLAQSLLEALRLAAEEQDTALVGLRGDALIEFSAVLARADFVEEADPSYRVETAASIRSTPSDDGIPASALPQDPERGSSLRLRDFTLAGAHPAADQPPLAEKPDVVLVVTRDDSPLSWLRAGQAMGAVLLHAARDGVMAQPLAQATDFPAAREQLRRALGLVGVPQMALRLGYAIGTATTPRRRVSDVLTDATAPAGEPLGALRVWESEGGHLRVGPDTLSEAGGAGLQDSRENGVRSVVSRVIL